MNKSCTYPMFVLHTDMVLASSLVVGRMMMILSSLSVEIS